MATSTSPSSIHPFLTTVDEANASFASSHERPWHFGQLPTNRGPLAILTCMDPRCNPGEFWQFGGDRSPAVLRNAGGRANEDALSTLRVLSAISGNGEPQVKLHTVAVVHHTNCGMITFSREHMVERTSANARKGWAQKAKDLNYGCFEDLEESVKEDMAVIKADPYLPEELQVVGYVYDVDSGKTSQVTE